MQPREPHSLSGSPPSSQSLVMGTLVFALGALCLLINLVGVARLAYDVVVLGALDNLLVKGLILSIVFWFGLGLGTVSTRRFANPGFPQFARIFAWSYLALVSLTYLGITLRIATHNYSLLQYGALMVVLILELISVLGLRLVVSDRTIGIFGIPILAIVLFHLGLVVYLYVFATAPLSLHLLGDLALLVFMAVVGSAMLGENAFRSVIERLIDRVG